MAMGSSLQGFAAAALTLPGQGHVRSSRICRGASGPRALVATKIPTEVLLAANHGVEWWEESEEGDAHWRCVRKAMDQSLGSPLFSLAIDEDTKAVAVGGGAGRATSIFGPQGDWLTQLQGHTGWVRDVLFYDKQLFSIGCNFIKVWRPKGPTDAKLPYQRWGSCLHVGDLEASADLLTLAVCSGALFAAGAGLQRHRWQLPSPRLRPKEWLAKAQATLLQEPSLHDARVTRITTWKKRLLSCGHDGQVCLDGPEPRKAKLGTSRLLSLAILDGDHFAVGAEDGTIHLLDSNLRLLHSTRHLQRFRDRVAVASTAVERFQVASLKSFCCAWSCGVEVIAGSLMSIEDAGFVQMGAVVGCMCVALNMWVCQVLLQNCHVHLQLGVGTAEKCCMQNAHESTGSKSHAVY
ncbi:unnamed protein product [Durusdinium trenchii]|uniref:Uncharacterized protein n=1 Tax=Durusdinium trenchii TaxID=1381693 RepID=A0ABP0LDY7_9DINO